MFDLALQLPLLFVVLFAIIYKILLLSLFIVIAEVAFKMMLVLPLFLIAWIFVKMILRKKDETVKLWMKIEDGHILDPVFNNKEAAKTWVRSLPIGSYVSCKELNSDGTVIHFNTT